MESTHVVRIPSELPLKKTDFSLQADISSRLVLGEGWEPMFTSPTQGWYHIWLEPMQSLSILSQSLWVHMCIGPDVSGSHCSLVTFTSSDSCNLSLLPNSSLRPKRKSFILFRTECSKVSHFLDIVQLWVSVLDPINCQKKLLWWWLRKALSYRYSSCSHFIPMGFFLGGGDCISYKVEICFSLFWMLGVQDQGITGLQFVAIIMLLTLEASRGNRCYVHTLLT